MKLLAVLAALMLVLAACGGDDEEPTPTTNGAEEDDSDDAAAGGTTLDVAAVDNSFNPDSLSAPAGEEITVNLTNSGQNPHTFTAESVGADTGTVDAGGTGTATFTMPDEPVEFLCSIHGSAMSGTIDPG